MTREEAIKVLSSYDVNGVWADVDGKPYSAEEQAEAFDMAIEALQTPPISQRSMYQAGYTQAQIDYPQTDIVRCGECKHWKRYDTTIFKGPAFAPCLRADGMNASTARYDYCSHGVRRDNE